MQISKEWLKEKNACQEGMEFVEEKKLIGLEGVEFIRKLMEYEQYEYSNWLIVRIMDREQCVKYANFSADLAKKWAESAAYCAERAAESAYWADCAESAESAESAAYCAERAAYCAESAYWADCAESAESAAYWAKRAAYWAENAESAYCAESAAYCAERAAYWAKRAAYWAENAAYKKILSYGLKLLEGK